VPDFDTVGETLSSIPGSPPDLAAPPSGCRFHPRCPFAQSDCVTGEFPLRQLEHDRSTACIHHEVCAANARREPVIADG
jgi:oligopeptide/dipeptide ABC transporter ATP-binding protein